MQDRNGLNRGENRYNAKDKQVKRSVREDKRKWMVENAVAAEKAAENGTNKDLYSITKTIVGERRRQEVDVKDQQVVLETETRERLQRWAEHFSEVLNSDDPSNPEEEDEIEELEEIEEIDLGRCMASTRGQERVEEDKSRENGWSR